MSRKLHLGGRQAAPDWEIFDALPGPAVDHLGNAKDLSCFADDTFEELYASHILEHFDYVNDLEQALKEWHRVLMPGGVIYISVPDMETLCRLYLDERRSPADRWMSMRMIFGGHTDPYDYHQVGLSEIFLGNFLHRAGFQGIRRVREFGLFHDSSSIQVDGVLISLNMIAFK
jgi:predicted SAM-dependent methyltransferase